MNKSTPHRATSAGKKRPGGIDGEVEEEISELSSLPLAHIPQLLRDSNGLVSNRFRIIFGERILAEREKRGSAGVMEETVVSKRYENEMAEREEGERVGKE